MTHTPITLYRVSTRNAVFGIEVDADGKIMRAAPYARARQGQPALAVLTRLQARWGATIEIIDEGAESAD
jgi:hypothetical protein